MQEPTGTVESNDDGEDGAQTADTQVRSPQRATRPGGRFYYATGDQPLPGFTIKRGIGMGGFGEVYYATSDAGKDVALKHIQRNLDVEVRGVKQCLNLKHPNLVSLFDIKYDTNDRAWVVMEYIAGESLQDVIDRNPNGMPLDQVQLWFEGIAAGVLYLNDHGIVHRDLKPGNIFIDQGVVKIGDYGLSKFISCSRRSGQTESVGTFHYMAPEIGRGKYGKEIDIYALGIILFEMLTGRVPFNGESSQEIIMKHLTAEPELDAIPLAFRPALSQALAKDPTVRTSDVRDLLARVPFSAKVSPSIDQRKNEEVIDAEAVKDNHSDSTEEPIARAMVDAWSNLKSSWEKASFGPATRAVLIVLMIFVLLVNSTWLVGLAMGFGLIYVCYLVVRAIIMANTPGATRSPQPVAARQATSTKPVRPVTRKRRLRRPWQDYATEMLETRTTKERFVELTGSLLLGGIVSMVICLVMLIVASEGVGTSFFSWAPSYLWMALGSTLATWSVLVVSKVTEGKRTDSSIRRFGMLVVGLLVGAACFALATFLLVEPTYYWNQSFSSSSTSALGSLPRGLYNADGSPTLFGYMGYFAGLFVALRWWKQTDPLRTNRLSVLATAICVLWAIALHTLLPCPRGFMFAAATSIAVQMAAPCMGREDRQHFQRLAREV